LTNHKKIAIVTPDMTTLNTFNPATDEELITEYQQTHEGGLLGELFTRHEKSLFSFLMHYTGGKADLVEEVISQTFVKVCEKYASFRNESSFKTWLYRIAIHTAIDINRRSSRHHTVSLERAESHNEMCDEEVSGELDPCITACRKEDCKLVQETVADLPDAQKRVVELVYYHNLMIREVAETLCIPDGTVKSRLHDAKRALRRKLGDKQVA
jgi:RNA polymerase sigma-70 factor, ECF subfamily